MEGADIRGGQECKSGSSSHSLFPGVGEGCGGDAHGRAEDFAQCLVAFPEGRARGEYIVRQKYVLRVSHRSQDPGLLRRNEGSANVGSLLFA